MKYDAVVIGAGASGLASAVILAKHGKKVALVESDARIAPVLRGFSRKGVYFDTGFHYSGSLGQGEPLEVFLRYFGVLEHIEKKPFDPEKSDLICYSDPKARFYFPHGFERVEEALCSWFPKERRSIALYMRHVRDAFFSSKHLNLDLGNDENSPLAPPHDAFDGKTLQEMLDSLFFDPVLKSLLCIHSFFHGVPPTGIAFSQHARFVGSYYQSAYGIKGGGLALVQAFDRVLDELGVERFLGQSVSRILADDANNVFGVRLQSGEVIECDAALCTVHPHVLLDIAPENAFRKAYKGRLRDMQETPSAFMLFLATDAPNQTLEAHNTFVCPTLDMDGVRLAVAPMNKRPMFITSSGVWGAKKQQGVSAICPATMEQTEQWRRQDRKRGEGYKAFKARVADDILTSMREHCPEVMSEYTVMDMSTPLTFSDFMHSPLGGLYGVQHRVGQFYPVPMTRTKGLFVSGQAIAGPGVLGAIISAMVTCEMLVERSELRREIQKCRV